MEKFNKIKKLFEVNKDDKQAEQMAKYMRNQFSFYGLKTPLRRSIYKDFIKAEKKEAHVDWDFLDECYKDEHREFQYLAYDYLLALNKYLNYEDIPKIEKYILTKSWWDTVDFLDKVIGGIAIRDARVKDLMKKWSKNDNIWIRRTAIQHQLSLKEKTDSKLLEEIIVNCFGSEEFFINKSIGWALREYSKTNPDWVRNFIEKYRDKMAKLSIKEASKYI